MQRRICRFWIDTRQQPVVGEIFPMIYDPRRPDEVCCYMTWKPVFLKNRNRQQKDYGVPLVSSAPAPTDIIQKVLKNIKYSSPI
jgi:hypothetical protein